MKRALFALLLVVSCAIGLIPRSLRAQALGPPPCATNGDKDGDGVPDADDADEKDSCLASSTGYEDCSTGAGDGIPDCK